jgi:hypothetical protein
MNRPKRYARAMPAIFSGDICFVFDHRVSLTAGERAHPLRSDIDAEAERRLAALFNPGGRFIDTRSIFQCNNNTCTDWYIIRSGLIPEGFFARR